MGDQHICGEDSLEIIAESGNLLTYRCLKCGKIQYAIGTPPVPSYPPSKRCKVFVQWRDGCSAHEQVLSFKKLFPDTRMSNAELLRSAKDHALLELMEVYLGEGLDLREKAKKLGLILKITEL